MKDNLTIKGENIQRVYDWYANNRFIVNRKYQRKLVWTLEEKQAFIESIVKDYPVPLFLIATNEEKYEIIDGMQRLNAVFSFIEGEFPIVIENKNYYFDLKTMPTTGLRLKNNKLHQKKPLLDSELCSDIANYQLPFSFSSFKEQRKIEDIFSRINSNGRQLSEQELRHSGSLGIFPDLVRKISAKVRRDSSPTILPLSQMAKFSLSNRKLKYGIYLFDVFWVKQNIITLNNMRKSRDEELIGFLLLYLILEDDVNPSARNLDYVYKFTDDKDWTLSSRVETEINKKSEELITNRFFYVYDEILKITRYAKVDLRELLFVNQQAKGMVRSFQVLFIAFYELMVRQKMKIKSYQGVINSLKGAGKRELFNLTNRDAWNGKYRREKVKAFTGILRPNFIENSNQDDPMIDSSISQLENLLMNTIIEEQRFDFKLGLYNLHTQKFNHEGFDKIIRSLTAMSNTSPKKKGYVFIGIPDNESDAAFYKKKFKKTVEKFREHSITGVQDEALIEYKDLDTYFNAIRDFINGQPIDDEFKSYLKRNMKIIPYYNGKAILKFELLSSDKPIAYNKSYYERGASGLEEIPFERYGELFARYK